MAKKLTAVLVGCGRISPAWLRPCQALSDLEIVGLVDIQEQAAMQRAEEHELPAALVGTDLVAMLEQTRPDLVFNCTVPEAHLPVTLEALRQGCHVLGEKPLADSMESARLMIAAAQEAGKLYAVMQNRRYDRNIRHLKSFLQSGVIGSITTVHSDFFVGAHIGDFRDHMRHVLLVDMAIHTFDAARFITGTDATSVYCLEWNPSGSWFDHDASAVAIFEMTGGIVFTYRGSWCAEGLRTPWESEWRIIGEKGSVTWDGAEGFQAQVVAETSGLLSKVRDLEIPPYSAPPGGGSVQLGGHGGLIQDFLHAVRTGRTPETSCDDNIKSLAMVFGAVESAERGEKVRVES